MDYKEEYEAMVQRARELHEAGNFLTKKQMEIVCPELAESEDERIRKKIIEHLEMIKEGSVICAIDTSEEIAWLEEQKDKNCLACDQHLKGYLAGRKVTEEEKQKENPKSADSIPSDCVSDVKCEDRSPKHTDSFGTDIRDTPAYWRGWDDAMKQKEQEHPNGCFTCDEYKKGYEAGRFHGFTAGYNKAKAEQKSAEWSEEDEKNLEQVIDVVYDYCPDPVAKYKLKDWLTQRLKSLRPQPKKSEYITSHKEFFKWIYDRLVSVHKDNPNVDYMISFKKRIEELSFDNLSWNPSEEQMSMLLAVIRDPNNVGSESCHLALESLYEDLQKLI